MASYRHWRVRVTEIDGAVPARPSIAEIEFRLTAGGADQCTGGTPSSQSSFQSPDFDADKAFDNNNATKAVSNDTLPWWVAYDFGAGNDKDIREAAIRAAADFPNQSPKTFTVEYSSDGSTWEVAGTFTDETGWTASELRTFAVQAADPPLVPQNVVATGGARSITVIWDPVTAPGLLGYRIYGSLDPAFVDGAATLLSGDLPTSPQSWTLTPVSPNEVWYFRVEAFTASASDVSVTVFASASSSLTNSGLFCALRCRWFPHVSRDDTSRVEVGLGLAGGDFVACAWVGWTDQSSTGHILSKYGNWRLHAPNVTNLVWIDNVGEVSLDTGGGFSADNRKPYFLCMSHHEADDEQWLFIWDPTADVWYTFSRTTTGIIQTNVDEVFTIGNHYAGGWNHNGYIYDARVIYGRTASLATAQYLASANIADTSLGTADLAMPLGEGSPEPNVGSSGTGTVVGLTALAVRPHIHSGYITALFAIALVGPQPGSGSINEMLEDMGHTVAHVLPANAASFDFSPYDLIMAVSIAPADQALAVAAIVASGKPVVWGGPKWSPTTQSAHTDVPAVVVGLIEEVDTLVASDNEGLMVTADIAHPMLVAPVTTGALWRTGIGRLTLPATGAAYIGTVIGTDYTQSNRPRLIAIDAGTALLTSGVTPARYTYDAALADDQWGDQFSHQMWIQRQMEWITSNSSLLNCGLPCHLQLDIYEDDRTTILTDFSTDPAHARPYLSLPDNYGEQEINPVHGSASIGQVEVMVIDRRLIDGDQDSGIVTDLLPDYIRGRRCRLRRFVDANIGWVTIADGPAATPRMDESFAAYRWIIRDTREGERKRRAFTTGGTTTIWPQGVLNDFSTVALAVEPNVGRYNGVSINLTYSPEYTAGLPPSVTSRLAISVDDLEAMTPDHLPGYFATESYAAPNHAFYVRQDSASPWQLLNPVGTPIELFVSTAVLTGSSPPEDVYYIQIVNIPTTTSVSLAINANAQIVIVSRGPASEYAPFHLSDITTGQLLKNGYDGLYSPRDSSGNVIPTGIRYDPLALLQMTDIVTLRLTEPVDDFRAWAEKFIYAPTGWIPALDNGGRISPKSQVPPANTAGLIDINNAITEPVPDWNAGERVINTVRFRYWRLFQPPDDVEVESRDRILARKEGREYIATASREPSSEATTVEFDGLAFSAAGDFLGAATIDPEQGATLASDRFVYIVPRYKDGAYTFDVPVMREATATLRAGDWVFGNLSWFPNYTTRRRGQTDLFGQVVAIADLDCAWRRLLIEEGVPLSAALPGQTLDDSAGVYDSLDVVAIVVQELEDTVNLDEALTVEELIDVDNAFTDTVITSPSDEFVGAFLAVRDPFAETPIGAYTCELDIYSLPAGFLEFEVRVKIADVWSVAETVAFATLGSHAIEIPVSNVGTEVQEFLMVDTSYPITIVDWAATHLRWIYGSPVGSL